MCFAHSNLYSAEERLKIVSVRGEGMRFELLLKYYCDLPPLVLR